MSESADQNRWLDKLVEQLRAIDGIEEEVLEDGRIAFALSFNGARRKVVLTGPAPSAEDDSASDPATDSVSDYRALKLQYSRLREALTEIGIEEGEEFKAPRRASGRAISPEMLAARAKQQQEHDSWQELWRVVRQAEKALDVEFEIAQMQDYY